MGKRWEGEIPKVCQFCGGRIGKVFYDAVIQGQWGLGCHPCWSSGGCGLGVGRGQKYSSTDGLKIEPKEAAKRAPSPREEEL